AGLRPDLVVVPAEHRRAVGAGVGDGDVGDEGPRADPAAARGCGLGAYGRRGRGAGLHAALPGTGRAVPGDLVRARNAGADGSGGPARTATAALVVDAYPLNSRACPPNPPPRLPRLSTPPVPMARPAPPGGTCSTR